MIKCYIIFVAIIHSFPQALILLFLSSRINETFFKFVFNKEINTNQAAKYKISSNVIKNVRRNMFISNMYRYPSLNKQSIYRLKYYF